MVHKKMTAFTKPTNESTVDRLASNTAKEASPRANKNKNISINDNLIEIVEGSETSNGQYSDNSHTADRFGVQNKVISEIPSKYINYFYVSDSSFDHY